ncbi:hypothetical protein V5O48_005855 [Marasmius crinis-equi]|uniref:SAP domain-containing protein n=1 Tax=Marasmius crinis-equi TaxID=585013 RepID=A0ABR3FLQ8_9AGAR
MSATTTEILFNSPALHSLKRDQLVKLCKIHSIKASGKNVELIAKLKAVAEQLPKDSALSIAARSEEVDEDVDEDGDQKMETVAELGGSSSSRGTLASHRSGEFGTASSKGTLSSSSSVTSSIKALASSLGLKRSMTTKSTISTVSSTSTLPPLPVFPKPANYPVNNDLDLYAKPYSAIPQPSPSSMPKLDNFAPHDVPSAASLAKFDFTNTAEPEPLPGHVLRPGAPAPKDARLSLGQTPATPGGKRKSGATTTIRLISNTISDGGDDGASTFSWGAELGGQKSTPSTPQLKPFKPTFDLVMGSPSTEGQRIYPALPMDDLIYEHSKTNATTTFNENNQKLPGEMPASTSTDPPAATLSPTSNEPKFIFGSPDPRKRPSVTNDDFRATASSVLDEVNKRLRQEGVETISSNIATTFRPGHMNDDGSPRVMKPLPKARSSVANRFDRMHEKQFSKMEGLGERKAAPSVSTAAPVAGRKRKSSVLGPADGELASPKKSKATVPGGFGDEEEDDDPVEDEGGRGGKKARVEFAEGEVDGKDLEEEQERLRKDREAIRRKLAMNREKRRSSGRPSVGRVSTGPRRSTLRLQKPPPKPAPANKSRFGFGFVSTAAKTIVRGVWGGSKKEKPAPQVAVSTTTITSTSAPAPTATSTNSGAPKTQPKPSIGSMGPPPVPVAGGHQRKLSSGLNAPGQAKRVASGTVSSMGTLGSTSSRGSTVATSRAPIPSTLRSGTNSTRTSSTGVPSSTTATASSRMSTVGAGRPSRSIRGSITQNTAPGSVKSRTSGSTNFLPTPVGSRLLAPTASSLAKAQGSVNKLRHVGPVPQAKPTSPSSEQSRVFDSITNSEATGSKLAALPSTPGKIFSKPLVVPLGSGIPSPVRNGVATAAPATTSTTGPTRQRSLMGRKPRISRSKVIARLASQRVASTSSTASSTSTATNGSGSTTARASLGPRVGGGAPRKSGGARRSHVGAAGGGRREARESAVMISAKKRVRQSEYARRKSRASAVGPGGLKMDVDA